MNGKIITMLSCIAITSLFMCGYCAAEGEQKPALIPVNTNIGYNVPGRNVADIQNSNNSINNMIDSKNLIEEALGNQGGAYIAVDGNDTLLITGAVYADQLILTGGTIVISATGSINIGDQGTLNIIAGDNQNPILNYSSFNIGASTTVNITSGNIMQSGAIRIPQYTNNYGSMIMMNTENVKKRRSGRKPQKNVQWVGFGSSKPEERKI